MVSVKIIAVGRLKEPYFKAAFDEYAKRLSPFCRLTAEEIEQERLPDSPSDKEIEKALETEAEKILANPEVLQQAEENAQTVMKSFLSASDLTKDYSVVFEDQP